MRSMKKWLSEFFIKEKKTQALTPSANNYDLMETQAASQTLWVSIWDQVGGDSCRNNLATEGTPAQFFA